MEFKVDDKVELNRDLPEWDLLAGAQGSVFDVYGPDLLEVVFDIGGDRPAVHVTVDTCDLQPVTAK